MGRWREGFSGDGRTDMVNEGREKKYNVWATAFGGHCTAVAAGDDDDGGMDRGAVEDGVAGCGEPEMKAALQCVRLTPLRPIRIFIVLACVVAVSIALACYLEITFEPRIAIGVLRYVDKNESWFPAAIVAVTNSGSVGVLYEHANPIEPVILRTESLTGSVSNVLHIEGLSLPRLLSPGSSIGFRVPLPEGTLRWQLRYTVRRASVYERAHNELTGIESRWGKWGYRLDRLGGDLLSTDEGPPQQFWSEVFEVPKGEEFGAPPNGKRQP